MDFPAQRGGRGGGRRMGRERERVKEREREFAPPLPFCSVPSLEGLDDVCQFSEGESSLNSY